ncbi:MAG TPA: cell division protein ZapE [Rhodospirillaceae bacterium]|jgi:cell division protein ZapE|nr:cell division protein ZapE [Rhodospirillaceae bacterium]
MPTPKDLYAQALRAGRLTPDAGQGKAVDALTRLHKTLVTWRPPWRRPPAGLYLHGQVGRGKTMLMDMFCAALPPAVPWRRVHFHAFMGEVHADLHARRAKQGVNNAALLPGLAKDAATRAKVLCLDEFGVRDVADALMLARLVEALWSGGVTLVTTSNEAPEDLYKGGLQRDLFTPFIALIRARMSVVSLDGNQDHRQGAPSKAYFCPLSEREAMRTLFESLGPVEPATLDLPGARTLELEVARGAAWARFQDLCERPHGAADYLALARAHGAVFVEGVPRMGYDRRNEALRFVHLIDVLYDEGCRVAVLAAGPPETLCLCPDVPFARTASRMTELAQRGWDLPGPLRHGQG